MNPDARSRKRGSSVGQYVYPAATMVELRSWFVDALEQRIPAARSLYWMASASDGCCR